MHIILTHEQADFDALASMLGAHLLDENTVPVLPRRMNRNVRAFLTLYGIELPFVDPRDLPTEPIEAVTLVDTQSMISIKNMVEAPRVRVIDHHPLKENLPEDWTITNVDIGATTTLMIEALREHNGMLSTVQATLLLLGIYEDTGSLTYSRTKPRDLRASAYLLEQGASLSLAADFLNHPLSPEQQAIYDELRNSTEPLHIHGHTVVLATGDARGMDEELSTIAHKLRDLLDPDALFLLFKTRGGIQLIARSTSDNIDVSEIAEYFGGGGHERAAAALIRERTLNGVHQELVEVLPSFVRPAITVAQIMSRGPQLLSPETAAEEAAQRMRRYGYEGYPVVKDGRVVGLLTRRAVDRALAHKLNLTAANLMDAGEVSVQPDDSVEELQRRMTDSGWGQIPVVDSEGKEIIGIVTRTDLLKILAPQPHLPRYQNLGSRLDAALPPTRLALLKAVASMAHKQRVAIYIVGGFVRDLLLERPSQDFDLVVEGDAISLTRSLAKHFGGRFTSHARFGTAKWHIADVRDTLTEELERFLQEQHGQNSTVLNPEELPAFVDLVTARAEFYTHPTALPTVERGSIKLDLHRRDFTINTLALRLDGRHYGELHDYWGGLNDLRHELVRVLHSLSFVDDPTRMLRAVRFEQRFDFRIEQRTLELMHQAYSLLDRVSGDRIRHELNHILDEPRAVQILARLNKLDLLQAIHPELPWDEWLRQRLQTALTTAPDPAWDLLENEALQSVQRELAYTLWFIRLSQEQIYAVAKRLKLPANLMHTIEAAHKLYTEAPRLRNVRPSRATLRLDETPLLANYAVYLACEDERIRQVLRDYASEWRHIMPGIDGHDLRQRGLPPSPAYRQILTRLRAAWLDGQVQTPADEALLLEQLIQGQEQDPA